MQRNKAGHLGSFFRVDVQPGASLPNGCDHTAGVAASHLNNGREPVEASNLATGVSLSRGAPC
ncbi:MAG: hypothetical protein AB7O57_20085 [Hyphomicrobiaceae bacterium]